MTLDRSSGILLHPTSLPGPFGIGDLGRDAFAFVDFLAEAKQGLWQLLPLGPTGLGNSPYTSLSSFAGNPLLISPDELSREGFLDASEIESPPAFSPHCVEYEAVCRWKLPLLAKAASRFLSDATEGRRNEFQAFCAAQKNWLNDFALFSVIREHSMKRERGSGIYGGTWNGRWDRDIALREPDALDRWNVEYAEEILVHKAIQFFFFQQWQRLRDHAVQRGIKIIGDLPIYAAYDSADLWANREIFLLDRDGNPTAVAGVPPDYFSDKGQLWGNPLYDWKVMAERGYRWWIGRIKLLLQLVDIIRIDHFRGFESYWAVPSSEQSAAKGRWLKGPGTGFFEALSSALGKLPIIAEDLGVITPKVEALRDRFGFPGMRVLQFAFDARANYGFDAANPFLPHNHVANSVVYTGTHDNDTTLGWYERRTPEEKDLIRRYLARPDDDIVWDLIRTAMSSVAIMAIIPLQDVLGLDSSARMNTPSVAEGNWRWRYRREALNDSIVKRLAEMARLYGRNRIQLETHIQ